MGTKIKAALASEKNESDLGVSGTTGTASMRTLSSIIWPPMFVEISAFHNPASKAPDSSTFITAELSSKGVNQVFQNAQAPHLRLSRCLAQSLTPASQDIALSLNAIVPDKIGDEMLEGPVVGAAVSAMIKALIDRLLSSRTPPEPSDAKAVRNDSHSTYAVETGSRIHYIRDQLLGLSKRQMCELLELPTVGQLERYEAGEEEFPLALIRSLERVFHVNVDYMDGRSECVFRQFNLCGDTVREYLEQGYRPVIVCNPRDRADLFCHITFERYNQAYPDVQVGNLLCSFASSGGGRINIEYLINAMLDLGMSAYEVQVLGISDVAWCYLVSSRYHVNATRLHRRHVDRECLAVWHKWFAETESSRHRWGLSVST